MRSMASGTAIWSRAVWTVAPPQSGPRMRPTKLPSRRNPWPSPWLTRNKQQQHEDQCIRRVCLTGPPTNPNRVEAKTESALSALGGRLTGQSKEPTGQWTWGRLSIFKPKTLNSSRYTFGHECSSTDASHREAQVQQQDAHREDRHLFRLAWRFHEQITLSQINVLNNFTENKKTLKIKVQTKNMESPDLCCDRSVITSNELHWPISNFNDFFLDLHAMLRAEAPR